MGAKASTQSSETPSTPLRRAFVRGVSVWDRSESKTNLGLAKDFMKGFFIGQSSPPSSTDAVEKQQDLALQAISESDRLIAISAALSKFVYTEGERMVRLLERSGLGASAFYNAKDDIAKQDGIAGWIADDAVLEIHEHEDQQNGIQEDGFDDCWVHVRYGGSPVFVKFHNAIAPRLNMQLCINRCTPGSGYKEQLEFRRSIAETLADLMQAAVKEDMKEDKKFSATDVEVFIETFTPDEDGGGTSSGTVEVRMKLAKLAGMAASEVKDMFTQRSVQDLESKIAEKLSLKVGNVHLRGPVGVLHTDYPEASKSNSGVFRRRFREADDLKKSLETLLKSDRRGFPRILKEDDQILYCEFKPGGALSPSSMSVLVQLEEEKKKVYFIAWQGTQIHERPMDIMTDLAAAPARCAAWHNLYPHVLAHSAIMAKVQSDFLEKFPPGRVGEVLEKRMPKGEEYEHVIMFTGHSLGGGCARIAHLIAHAELELVSPRCDHIQVRSYTFAAPMVFYVEKKNDDKNDVKHVRKVFANNSVNCVCEDDVVPRLPAYPEFALTAIERMLKGVLLGTAKRHALDIIEGGSIWNKAEPFLNSTISDFVKNSALLDLGDALRNFEHMADIKWFRPVSDCSNLIVTGPEDKISDFGTPRKAWQNIPAEHFASLMLAYHSWILSSVRYVPPALAADAGTRKEDEYQVIYFEISESQSSQRAGDSRGLPFDMPSLKLARTEALHECLLQDDINTWSIDLDKLKGHVKVNHQLAQSLNHEMGFINFDATPIEEITLPQLARKQLGIPDSAMWFSWCYPAPAVSGLNLGESEDANFLMSGGYMYFDKRAPVALLAVSISSDGQLTFGERQDGTKQDFNDILHRSNRFQAVTIPQLRECGLDRFTWLRCNERIGERTIRHGGFAYLCKATASSPAAGPYAAAEQQLYDDYWRR
eukprot:TRINITY_DN16489_c0_g1_i1.p1 TRINITY_DN16489_c0_g1~~TRINITY_DN16489_c0_g1_i1.p1  ORF type:complete len:969 (+),score=154.11 TRINITY_DN16489_c0_g1_i1:109-2907(+)